MALRLLIAVLLVLWPGLIRADTLATDPILRIETGQHVAVIRRIGLSADQHVMVSGSDDKTARLWSIPDGRLLRTFRMPIDQGNGGQIYAIDISPDGKLIAAGGWDAAYDVSQEVYVYVWDAATGAVVRRLGPLPSVVVSLRFSADGRHLAAGISGKSGIRVWDVASGNELLADKDYGDDVLGLGFARDGRLAATSYDGSIRLYDVGGHLLHKVQPQGGKQPSGIAFAPDGQSLVLGYHDTLSVDVLRASDLTQLFHGDTADLSGGNLNSVAWSADGQGIFAGGTHGEGSTNPIYAFSRAGRGPRQALPGPGNTIMNLRPYGTSGVAYAAADPGFGLMGDNGQSLLRRDPITADMRVKLGADFGISSAASQVRFGLGIGGTDPYLFDVSQLSLVPAATAPADLKASDVTGLAVAAWQDNEHPTLNGNALALDPYEVSHSVAVLPDKSGLVLGTEWHLRRFDANGKQLWQIATPGAAWGVNLSADGKTLVAALDDGTVRWYRTLDGKELLALFVYAPDKRWVLWTPSGYYAASAGGENLIGWHVNHGFDQAPDFFPASRFHDAYDRPDIVQKVLDTLDEAEAVKQANIDAKVKQAPKVADILPPVVAILNPGEGSSFAGDGVTLHYSLRSPSGLPVDGVDVLVDGSLVSDPGVAKIKPPELRGKDDVKEADVELKLPPKDVEVGLRARSGTMAGSTVSVHLTYKGQAPEPADIPKPKLYALVIGVNSYEKADIPSLRHAVDDARGIADALQKQEGGLYSKVEVKLLTDGAARRGDIIDDLDWLSRQMTDQDVAVFYVAGHGVTDDNNRYYILPHDVDLEHLKKTGVSRDDITSTLSQLPGKVLVFLDTCQAAAVGSSQVRGGINNDALVNDLINAGNGQFVFAAATGKENSQESDQWGHGAFTKAILDGLAGGADFARKGIITTAGLNAFIANEVKDLTGGHQHPVLQVANKDLGDLTFAVVR